mgnify:CR=1 FL=1
MTAHRDYNREAKSLPDKAYQYNFDHIVRDYMIRSFQPFFRTGNAMELGCYEGDTAVQLAPFFTDMAVVEAASDALDIARARLPKNTLAIHSIFETLAIEHRFDNIFMINVLEHVEEVVPVLTHIRQFLKPGGRFFVLVPNADAPSRQIAVKMGLIESNAAVTPAEWAHGHRRTYTLDTLERDVKKAQFKVMQRGGIIFKALANFQFDRALAAGIIDADYIEGAYQLGQQHPALCASIFLVCE